MAPRKEDKTSFGHKKAGENPHKRPLHKRAHAFHSLTGQTASHTDTPWLLGHALPTLFNWKVLARWIYDPKKWSQNQNLSSTCCWTLCPRFSPHREDSASPTVCLCNGKLSHQKILTEPWHNWALQLKRGSRNSQMRGRGEGAIDHWRGLTTNLKVHPHQLKFNSALTLMRYLQRPLSLIYFSYTTENSLFVNLYAMVKCTWHPLLLQEIWLYLVYLETKTTKI